MTEGEGHELGHRHLVDAFTWGQYVLGLRDQFGGWTDLVNALQEWARGRDGAVASADPGTVEKGLRRLADRGQAPGDKYGRLLLRAFGLPASIQHWSRVMGQYHSRVSDLPVALRAEQLLRWNRPPISETPAAAWVHVALASVAHREHRFDDARVEWEKARRVGKAEATAKLEVAVFGARLASDLGDLDLERALVGEAERLLDDPAVTAEDVACYRARLVDQRAFRLGRSWRTDLERVRDALALYDALPAAGVPPFAAFRREQGRGWCLWRLGDHTSALAASRAALAHAGDGGFVRLRVLALELQADILGVSPESQRLRERAQSLRAALGDVVIGSRPQPIPKERATTA